MAKRSLAAGTSVTLSLLAAIAALQCSPSPEVVPAPVAPAVTAAASASEEAPPLAPPAVGFGDGFHFETTLKEPADPNNLCELADSNLDRDIATVIAQKDRRDAPANASPWDHARRPEHSELVETRFVLTAEEKAKLRKNGFVVPARLTDPNYAHAYHEIFQSQLPVYISMDSLFYALFRENDDFIEDIEKNTLEPKLKEVLDALSAALPGAKGEYPADVAVDLDVYLAVARSLLTGAAAPSALGNDAEVARLVAQAKDASQMTTVKLFGRDRVVDFSQYRPRGHYESMDGYFRAGMWLSRLEWNLVSRSSRSSAPGVTPDPRETPREALGAFALADLADRAGVLASIGELDRAWGMLAGRREDVSLATLVGLRKKAAVGSLKDPGAFDALKVAIGGDFKRTARVHYMPQGSTDLPVIATLLGPRIGSDAVALRPIANDETPDRERLGAADVAYLLGQDHALSYLREDLARFPVLRQRLGEGRVLAATPEPIPSLYGAWLGAIRALSEKPEGALPSFTATEAFGDLRLGSTAAAYGGLRHNYVLMSAQSYFAGGCEIPDGYVEPAPGVLDALIRYTDLAASMGGQGDVSFYTRAGVVLRALRVIVADELAGRALTVEERRFLGGVAEILPATSGHPAMYNGWYFRLFRSPGSALRDASYVGEIYTSPNRNEVGYVGSAGTRLGIFVIDTGGSPRLAVGPVARGFEHHASLAKRLTDKDLEGLSSLTAPWERSYTPAAPRVAEPPLAIIFDESHGMFAVRSTRTLGPIKLEALDHHGLPCWTATVNAGPRAVKVKGTRSSRVPAEESCSSEMGRGYRVHYQGVAFETGGELGKMEPLPWDVLLQQ